MLARQEQILDMLESPANESIRHHENKLRVRPALLRELQKIAAESERNVSEVAEGALRQFVRSHRENAHLTRSRANVRRLRAAHAEIEAELGRRRRKAA